MFIIGSIDFLNNQDRKVLLEQARAYLDEGFDVFAGAVGFAPWMIDFCDDDRSEDDCLTEAEVKRINSVLREAWEIAREEAEAEKALVFQFEATPDGNVMWAENSRMKVVCRMEVPEEASEDYGYITMKKAIASALTSEELSAVTWWYDERTEEDYLAEDASAGYIDRNDIHQLDIERF